MPTFSVNPMDSRSPAQASHLQFSIVIAVLNGAETLSRCLESIIFQSNTQWELIVMDGGSTDGSVSIIRRYEDHITFWESQPDRGIYHAWNKALKHARGEWVCFLGADDFFWNAQVLSNLSPHLEAAPVRGVKIIYGRVVKMDAQGKRIKVLGRPWPKIRWSMLHGMPLHLPHPGLMHHRSLFDDFGLFDETFRIAGDYEFLLRGLQTNNTLFVENLITLGSRVGGIADGSGLKTNLETARARKKHGLKRFSWVWTAVFMRACVRTLWHKFQKKQHKQ
jgi:glycosyltransferase involved in cell wall biosynthesis